MIHIRTITLNEANHGYLLGSLIPGLPTNPSNRLACYLRMQIENNMSPVYILSDVGPYTNVAGIPSNYGQCVNMSHAPFEMSGVPIPLDEIVLGSPNANTKIHILLIT